MSNSQNNDLLGATGRSSARARQMLALLLTIFAGTMARPAASHAAATGESKPVQTGPATGVGITQRLGEVVPGDLTFRDESGQTVRLADYYGEKPLILALVYYKCPGACNYVLNGISTAANAMRLAIGDDYEIVTVSFDPDETPALAAKKKKTYVHRYQRDGAERGWHFLTGDESSIRQLADAVGFRYRWDESTQQFAHGAGIMLLTPEGKLSRYFYEIDYHPRDVELGLVESSSGKIGSPVHEVLLFCFRYDPLTGKYGLAVSRLLQAGGALTVLSLAIFITRSLRQERRAAAALAAAGAMVQRSDQHGPTN